MSGQRDKIYQKACRVCMDTKFSESVLLEPGSLWLEQFEYCSGLTIEEKDTPKILCLSCAGCIKDFVSFKKKCHSSHQLWRTIINNVKYSENSITEPVIDLSLVKEEDDIKESVCFLEVLEPSKNDVKIENNLDLIADDNFEDILNYDDYNDTADSDYKVSKPKKTRISKRIKRKAKKKSKGKSKTDSELDIVYPCGLCDFLSSEEKAVTDHLEEHRTKNEFSCKSCTYEGRDFADMVSHRFKHTRRFPLVHVACHVCHVRFQCSNRLEFHYRSEHLGKDGGWCSFCNQTFTKQKTWWRHERMHDDNIKKYECDHCGKLYLYKHEIEAHWLDMSDVKKYICETCGSGFKRYTYLTVHISTVHQNTSVKCDHCGLTYKNNYRLQQHLKLLNRKREFVCKTCSKTFIHAAKLKKHEFWHTGERPYTCDMCGKGCKNKSEFVVHTKRHRGIYSFKCSLCPKAFVTGSQLKVHSAVHTGVRRHKCTVCDRSYNNRKAFVAHCLSKHNIREEDIVFSGRSYVCNRIKVS